MNIKRASFDDLDGVSRLFNGYRQFYGQEDNLALSRQFIEERLEEEDSVIFVAQSSEGNYLGFTQLYPSFSSVSMARVWILNDLYIDSSARRSGVGSLLMQAARSHAIDTGAVRLSLQTAHDNHTAQALYESLGYEVDKHFHSYNLHLDNS